jgi:hypothetical protein
MPFGTINFTPGLNKDDTPLASEGGWIDADKIRFVDGRPQVMGGWQAMTSDNFAGVARGAHAWATMVGRRILAWGTEAKLYAMIGGSIRDITPPHSEGVLTNPFSVSLDSTDVVVDHAGHGLKSGNSVTFSNQSLPVGGLTLNGTYTVTVSDPDTYAIVAASPATSSAIGGGNIDFRATLPAGLIDGIGEPGGFGTGAYSAGGYGETIESDSLPRVWFLDNWGETLLALPRDGALYQYQPALDYPELVANGEFDSSARWTAGTGWAITGGVAAGAAGSSADLSHDVAFVAGYVYRVTADVVITAGTLTIKTDGDTLGFASSAISATGRYSRRFRAPAESTAIRFTKDAAFIGSIDNVSVTLEPIAYRVDEAPMRSSAMFVDPHQIAVLLGTNIDGGVYNPMLVRWSDRQDITAWTPTVSNLAGDNILASGGRIVGGLPTRLQNLIWTDSSLVTMTYLGDAKDTFQFDLAGTGCGLIGALARTEHNGTVFWIGPGNFFRYDGAVPAVIPCKIERDFFAHIAENQHEKITLGVLPGRSEVWALYPDERDGTECSRYVAHRWSAVDVGHFTGGTFARSSLVKPGIFPNLIMFGTDGIVYEHETGQTANGGEIHAYLESAYWDIGEGDNLQMIRRVEGDFQELNNGYVDFIFTARMRPTSADVPYPAMRHTSDTEKLDCRITGRQVKVRMESRATPLYWRVGAPRLDIMKLGAMR